MGLQLNQRSNNLMAVHSNYSSPQHSTIKSYSNVESMHKVGVVGGSRTVEGFMRQEKE
jgi:hypothetical protein